MAFIIFALKNIDDLWFLRKAFIIFSIYIQSFVADSLPKKVLQILTIVIGGIIFLFGTVFFRLHF